MELFCMSLTTASTLDCFTAIFCLAHASYSPILLPKGLKPENSFTATLQLGARQ